jgi:glycosyltransferase involved in cell wall biosynthesis
MHVFFVSDSRYVGGAEVYLVRLISFLARNGIQSTIVAPAVLLNSSQFVRVIDDHSDAVASIPFGNSMGELARLVSLMKRFSTPVVLHLNLAAPFSRRLFFYPLLGVIAGVNVISVTENLPSIRCRWVSRLLKSGISRWLTFTIAVSQSSRIFISKYFWMNFDDIKVINYGVPIPGILNRLSARDRILVDHDAFTILQVASLEERKGQSILLRAMDIVRGSKPEIKFSLLFVGSGPDRDRLAVESSSGNLAGVVRFCGQQEDVSDYYAASDLFLLPSKKEAFPISILEAMSHGLPVIASEVDGIPEQIQHGETGFLVPYGDVVELAACILRVVGDPVLRDRMGAKARQRAVDLYSVDASCQATLDGWVSSLS